jgi:hypothetical protein
MKKDSHKTQVLFRVDKQNNVFALFPYEIADLKGNVTTYERVGQHGAGDYKHCIKTSRIATKREMLPLLQELQNIGYNLEIVKRQNYSLYLKNFKNIRTTFV